jgi:glycosyltransferase involved in cell wall biosynthesis
LTPLGGRAVRVGFDGRALSSPAPGVRRYTRELVAALIAGGMPIEIVSLGGPPPSIEGVAHRPEPWHPPTNLGWTVLGLPRAARGAALDVYHAPAYTAPLWGVHPLVLTIHDVSYARHPEWYPYHRDWMRRAFYRASARAADTIVTDSEFAKQEIIEAYGLAPDRIEVIPLGVGRIFRPASIPSDSRDGDDPRVTQITRKPFILHVGDLHARRRVEVALRALIEARKDRRVGDVVLVAAGIDRGVGRALRQSAAEAGAPDALVLAGAVDEPTLVALYQQARAFVYPSVYEGFGLPLVEAMACGTPVIAARAATAAEVTGTAAVLLPPGDTGAWIEALTSVLTDQARVASMRAAGVARAAGFTWARTAARTYEVYRRAAGYA